MRLYPRFSSSAYDFSSFRDRTKDILSVAFTLLFGVGCGTLTATTMYLVWPVFATCHHIPYAYDNDEIQSTKKLSYVHMLATDVVTPSHPRV
ncbi:hypothetical protein Fmac_026100 [Flemingia macrophylla]|uniref:Uncharacterized protein n=1 Tax=Flemingia macrophylla TaxID=520843 RepID=A0ABD1LE21_9FABA